MRKFILATLIVAISTSLVAKFKSIDAEELIKMQKQGIPVIDIRTPKEWRDRGVIKNAHLIMFFDEKGNYDTKEFLEKLKQIVKNKKEPFIIYCAHSNRTKEVGKWLSDKVGYKKVYELNGGIEYGWRNIGKPIKRLKN